MKIFKKVLCVGVALICIFSIAACSDKKCESDLQTITWWSGASHEKTTMTKLIDEFNKNAGKNMGVKIAKQPWIEAYNKTIK